MSTMEEKITLIGDDGEEIELFVLEETRIGGKDYLLVTDVQEGDGDCYILKDISDSTEATAVYEMVEDAKELDYLIGLFSELLEDIDLEG